MSLIDNDGYVLTSTLTHFGEHHRLSHKDTDFAISLHFESPKTNDIYTYYALWNPVEFFFDWGYEKTVEKILTHDDLLSCASDFADNHALNLFESFGRRPPTPLPRLNHTISGKVLPPALSEKSRVFYVGINWERINNRHGRHHLLLSALDEADLIDIYGPETFHGVRPWEGYRGYRGSIPFDGVSTVRKIADSGICLAFSSAAHQRSGMMSNRLFEGLAAGALVIANTHPLIDKYFGDAIDVIDDAAPPEEVISQVKHIVRWGRENPRAATEKAAAAQQIFLEHFTLESLLAELCAQHEARVEARAARLTRRPTVEALVVFAEQRLSRLAEILDDLDAQTLAPRKVVVLCDATWWERNRARIEQMVAATRCPVVFELADLFSYNGLVARSRQRKAPVGPVLWRMLTQIDSELFALVKSNDALFHDHFESLARELTGHPARLAAQAGILIEYCLDPTRPQRRFAYNAPKSLEEFFFCNQDRYSGANLYKREILARLSAFTVQLTDGQEHNYLNGVAFLNNALTFSNKVTYLYREQDEKHILPSVIAPAVQHQYIRDALVKARATMEIVRIPKLPEVIFAHQDATPPLNALIRRPLELSTLIRSGEIYRFNQGGNGAPLLADGWSHLEKDGVWMEGRAGSFEFGCASEEDAAFHKVRFTLKLEGRSARGNGRTQHVTCFVNGAPIAYFEVGLWFKTYTFDAPRDLFGDSAAIRLRLVADHDEPVLDDSGDIVDARRIGLKIVELQCDLLH